MAKSVQPIPSGHEGLIPHLVCDPCSKAIDFYKKAFGAEEIMRCPMPDGRMGHAEIKIGDSRIMLAIRRPISSGETSSTWVAMVQTWPYGSSTVPLRSP